MTIIETIFEFLSPAPIDRGRLDTARRTLAASSNELECVAKKVVHDLKRGGNGKPDSSSAAGRPDK